MLKKQFLETKYTHSSNIWLTSELKNLHFPSVPLSLPACFNLRIQLSRSAGKHCGRVGSTISKFPSPDCIPFWSKVLEEALTTLSGCVLDIFSVAATLLLPFTCSMTEFPGSVFTIPWLLSCEFSDFAGEDWLVEALFGPCETTLGLWAGFEEIVPEVKVFFVVEEGDDKRFVMFAFPMLSFLLCFFSLSFSPLKRIT